MKIPKGNSNNIQIFRVLRENCPPINSHPRREWLNHDVLASFRYFFFSPVNSHMFVTPYPTSFRQSNFPSLPPDPLIFIYFWILLKMSPRFPLQPMQSGHLWLLSPGMSVPLLQQLVTLSIACLHVCLSQLCCIHRCTP